MSKSEQAKAAGWRIECLGDQWEGLFNWLLWTPNDDGCIQTKYPLASEAEAWRYFFGFVKGLQYAIGVPTAPATQEPAPVSAAGLQLKLDVLVLQRDSLRNELAIVRGERDALLAVIRKWTYTSMDGFTFVTDDHGEVAATALAASDGEG